MCPTFQNTKGSRNSKRLNIKVRVPQPLLKLCHCSLAGWLSRFGHLPPSLTVGVRVRRQALFGAPRVHRGSRAHTYVTYISRYVIAPCQTNVQRKVLRTLPELIWKFPVSTPLRGRPWPAGPPHPVPGSMALGLALA